jgi:flagellar motility protein MotE (MotC chaperone)
MMIKPLIAVVSLAATLTLAALAPAALAQTTTPDETEKPVAPKKPKAAPAEEQAPKGVSIAEKAQNCLKIEDETMERLNCYDAAVKPQPNPKAPPAKGIRDCRYLVDINERLGCFNGFALQIPKFTH